MTVPMVPRASWKIAVSVAVVAMLVWAVDWPRLVATARAADLGWIAAVVLTIHADKAWMAGKWLLLARGAGVPLTFGAAIQSYYIGSFWGGVLPASVGGDVIRVSWLTSRGHELGRLAWSVVVERVLGALAQAVTGLAGLLVLASAAPVAGTAFTGAFAVFAVITVVAAAALFSASVHEVAGRMAARVGWMRLERAVAKTKRVVLEYRGRRTRLLGFLALSLLEQAFPILSTFALARAFSIDLSLGWLVVGVPIILAVSRLPLSVHDYGIKEGAYAAVLSLAGLTVTQSITLALVDRILVLLAMLPGAFWIVNLRSSSAVPQRSTTVEGSIS
jgi:uncharacterized protein (TIRG00374 family)